MPLHKEITLHDTQIYLWKYTEGEPFNPHALLEPEHWERLQQQNPKRQLETLMVRQILHQQLPEHRILYADRVPYLSPATGFISISHAFPYAVLAVSKRKIGVDIEAISEKILRVKDKFTTASEQLFLPKGEEKTYLTLIWSIKESLYKLHPAKHWSLKKHYEVLPFTMEHLHQINCRVYDSLQTDFYTAQAFLLEDLVLSVVVED